MRRNSVLLLLVLATCAAACGKSAPSGSEASAGGAPSPAATASRPVSSAAAEWPQFRGPGGLAISPESGLPETWGKDGSGVRWKSNLPGWGNSSPIVAAGKVFLTTAYPVKGTKMEDAERGVVAFDLASGKLLWETKLYRAPIEKRHRLNTSAAPTPVWDRDRLYVYFGSVLAAVDGDGKLIWQQEIDDQYAKYSRYGAASSPVVTEKAVIVVQDRESGQSEEPGWMAAYDKADGRRIWRVEWNDTCCAYSTPLVLGSGADEEILFGGSHKISGFDPATGERLWSHSYPINQMVASPSVDGDLIAVAGGAHNVRSTHLLRRHGKGKETRIEVLRSHQQFAPETASPVLYKGLFYTITESGVMACYQADTGEMLWKAKAPHGGGNRPSLVAGDGKVYVFSRSGAATILAAEPAYRVVATNDLGEQLTDASPAIADGCLILRGKESLLCIGSKS